MSNFIPVNSIEIGKSEMDLVMECLETGWISSEGPFVSLFEEKMAKQMKRDFGVAVCNGTAALEVAIAALELQPGEEIIMPTFTIISCAAAIVRTGAIPVLVDSDPVTWNMNVEQIEKKITSRTRAIMAVHIYGMPVDMKPLLEIADKYGLLVIEDAAQMHGQLYNGEPCGSFGDISVLSFYPNKHITTGEGGMVLTNNSRLAERCRSLRNLCFIPERRFVHEELGYNYRMTNLQAALGIGQIDKLQNTVQKKRQIGALYTSLLKDVEGITIPIEETSYARNIYWVFGVILKEGLHANKVMDALKEHNIGTRPFFWPMHEQPVFQKMGWFKGERYPVAEKMARQGFYLPSGVALTDGQIRTSAESLIQILQSIEVYHG